MMGMRAKRRQGIRVKRRLGLEVEVYPIRIPPYSIPAQQNLLERKDGRKSYAKWVGYATVMPGLLRESNDELFRGCGVASQESQVVS